MNIKLNNKFKFIVPSYNNEKFVEYNLASILNQTYSNWEVLYIDDASTDNTFEVAKAIVEGDNRFKMMKREKNMGATYNYFFELEKYLTNDEDIVLHLDGDDWLYDDNVLDSLNNLYNEKEYWMTYGKVVCYPSGELGNPHNTPYPDYVIENKLFRKDLWRASHFRTYKTFLYKTLNKKELFSDIDGKLFWHATDLAFQFAYMEMCKKDKIGVVDFITYVYNQSKDNQIRTAEREHQDNYKFEEEIRNRPINKEIIW